MMQTCLQLIQKHTVLFLAAIAAGCSMLWQPPSAAYAGYLDLRVLALLFCLMAVVAGFQQCGVLTALAQRLLTGKKQSRLLCLLLVLLPFFCSMLITNDVALIVFVPFAILVLELVGQTQYLIYIIVLQTVAANLGSMATPIGNPQNLFLYSKFQIPATDFFAVMLPLVLVSIAGLCCCAVLVKNHTLQVRLPAAIPIADKKRLGLFSLLFALCLLCVFRVLHYGLLFAIVAGAMLCFERNLFRQIDYGLLLTFVCFFIFAGNLGQLESARQFFGGLLHQSPVLTAVTVSQVISNVPAAVLLSGFSGNWQDLLVGVNLGGLGTLVASLASLISFQYYSKTANAKPFQYLLIFTLVNLAWLALFFTLGILQKIL